MAVVGLMLFSLLLILWDNRSLKSIRDGLRLSRDYYPVMIEGNWNHPVTESSHYLKTGRFIRSRAEEKDRIAFSGIASWSVLSGLPPVSDKLLNLFYLENGDLHNYYPEEHSLLALAPPRFVLIDRSSLIDMERWIPEFAEKYHRVFSLEKDPSCHYGRIEVDIWERL